MLGAAPGKRGIASAAGCLWHHGRCEAPRTLRAPARRRHADAKAPRDEAGGRRGAETLLCVLSVLDGVLSQTQAVEEGTLDELLGDVNLLINRHPFVQVLAAACGCLTTLAARDTAGARALATTAASFAGWLRDPASARAEGRPQLLVRFLFILGQLCRRGAGNLEATAPDTGGPPLAMADCLRLFVHYCAARDSIKVRCLGGGSGRRAV